MRRFTFSMGIPDVPFLEGNIFICSKSYLPIIYFIGSTIGAYLQNNSILFCLICLSLESSIMILSKINVFLSIGLFCEKKSEIGMYSCKLFNCKCFSNSF